MFIQFSSMYIDPKGFRSARRKNNCKKDVIRRNSERREPTVKRSLTPFGLWFVVYSLYVCMFVDLLLHDHWNHWSTHSTVYSDETYSHVICILCSHRTSYFLFTVSSFITYVQLYVDIPILTKSQNLNHRSSFRGFLARKQEYEPTNPFLPTTWNRCWVLVEILLNTFCSYIYRSRWAYATAVSSHAQWKKEQPEHVVKESNT